jgi:hypothetical protein
MLSDIVQRESNPFKVCFDDARFWVYSDDDEDDIRYRNMVVRRRPYKKVFVGKSPLNRMTKFSGGHGPAWDGNSVLFELDGFLLQVECWSVATVR